MNEAEAEQVAALYEQKGWRRAECWQEADELVIYSCSVREAAENRVRGLLQNVHKWKSAHRSTTPKVILTGCMVGSATGERRRFTMRQLKAQLPPVDEFRSWSNWEFQKINPLGVRRSVTQALIPIMKGCNHFCTYCVVPFAKGREVSLPFDQIVCQIEELATRGWGEFTLLGQNVNSYGKDFSPAERANLLSKYHVRVRRTGESVFALLLKTIHEIVGVKKISFITSNPWDLTDEIIRVMKLPKIDRYFHLAVQSGDDEVLRRMNRGYTADEFLGLVKKLRRAIPDIQIGTDIIVGFPGETQQAFQKTVDLCQKVGFEKAYISKYSVRPGTAAARMTDDIPYQEKQRRWRELEKLINTQR